tara:strand:- start:342 stop:872 length:531 start_codon:yes stop_codon:yes gene_type:complete
MIENNKGIKIMFKSILTMSSIALVATVVFAESTPIVGNVSSKCTIWTDTAGVYGNPTPDNLSTASGDGGVQPVIRYDVSIADYYTAKISWPNAFSSSPSLTDSLTWDGEIEVHNTSDAGMSGYEAAKVEYDNHTEYDLSVAGSTWFKVTSTVDYGQGKSLPGGEYTANVTAECVAD